MMNYLEKKKKAMLNSIASGGLPSEYQEVDYIEGSGTQYIKSNVKADIDVSIKINYAINTEQTSDVFICGSRIGVSDRQLTIRHRANNSTWVITPRLNGAGNSCDQQLANTVTKETFRQVDVMCTDTTNEIYIDNTLRYSNTDIKTAFDSGNLIWLFACNLNGVGELMGKFKIAHCELWKGNTKEQEFIPCYRKSDDVVGMYDLVTDTFFTNSGRGSFTYGTEV